MLFWAGIAAFALFIVVSYFWTDTQIRVRQNGFASKQAAREAQSPQDFAAACHIAGAGDTAERVRRILAKVSGYAYSPPQFSVEPDHVRADDDLIADLGFDLDSLSFVELFEELDKEFGVRIPYGPLLQAMQRPLRVSDVVCMVETQLKTNPPLIPQTPDFRPGFRLSVFDMAAISPIITLGISASLIAGSHVKELGGAIFVVVGHFFLFCNVFRVARSLELAWSFAFLGLVFCTVWFGIPSWPATFGLAAASSLVVVGLEMRKPSYHGVFWQRINPGLPEWWKSNRKQG